MATAEAGSAGTARELDTLRQQARMLERVVGLNIGGVTHAQSLVRPQPAGSCMNWILGHLLVINDHALRLLGQEPVMQEEARKLYDRGSPPLADDAAALDFSGLVTAWAESSRRMRAGLDDFAPGTLDQPAPFSPNGDPGETMRSVFTTLAWHQAYHAGQTGVLRRVAGKEGVIR